MGSLCPTRWVPGGLKWVGQEWPGSWRPIPGQPQGGRPPGLVSLFLQGWTGSQVQLSEGTLSGPPCSSLVGPRVCTAVHHSEAPPACWLSPQKSRSYFPGCCSQAERSRDGTQGSCLLSPGGLGAQWCLWGLDSPAEVPGKCRTGSTARSQRGVWRAPEALTQGGAAGSCPWCCPPGRSLLLRELHGRTAESEELLGWAGLHLGNRWPSTPPPASCMMPPPTLGLALLPRVGPQPRAAPAACSSGPRAHTAASPTWQGPRCLLFSHLEHRVWTQVAMGELGSLGRPSLGQGQDVTCSAQRGRPELPPTLRDPSSQSSRAWGWVLREPGRRVLAGSREKVTWRHSLPHPPICLSFPGTARWMCFNRFRADKILFIFGC